MTHVTCRLTAKNGDQLGNPTQGMGYLYLFTPALDWWTAQLITTQFICIILFYYSIHFYIILPFYAQEMEAIACMA